LVPYEAEINTPEIDFGAIEYRFDAFRERICLKDRKLFIVKFAWRAARPPRLDDPTCVMDANVRKVIVGNTED
jgi:hypothetical protein